MKLIIDSTVTAEPLEATIPADSNNNQSTTIINITNVAFNQLHESLQPNKEILHDNEFGICCGHMTTQEKSDSIRESLILKKNELTLAELKELYRDDFTTTPAPASATKEPSQPGKTKPIKSLSTKKPPPQKKDGRQQRQGKTD
jgi:hypothetical protein